MEREGLRKREVFNKSFKNNRQHLIFAFRMFNQCFFNQAIITLIYFRIGKDTIFQPFSDFVFINICNFFSNFPAAIVTMIEANVAMYEMDKKPTGSSSLP